MSHAALRLLSVLVVIGAILLAAILFGVWAVNRTTASAQAQATIQGLHFQATLTAMGAQPTSRTGSATLQAVATPIPPVPAAPPAQQVAVTAFPQVCSGTKGNSPYSDQTGLGQTAHWTFSVPAEATAFVWGGSVNGQADGYKVFMEKASVDVTVRDGAYCLVDTTGAERAWNTLLAETANNPHRTKPDCPSGWTCRSS
jgi:hypothetical protein